MSPLARKLEQEGIQNVRGRSGATQAQLVSKAEGKWENSLRGGSVRQQEMAQLQTKRQKGAVHDLFYRYYINRTCIYSATN